MRKIDCQKKEVGFALMMVLWVSALLGIFLLILSEKVHSGYQITRMNRDLQPLSLKSRNGFYRMAEYLSKENLRANGFNQKEKPFKGFFKIDLESWRVQWLGSVVEGDLKEKDDESNMFLFVSVMDSKFPLSGINRSVLSKVENLETSVIEQILNLNLKTSAKKKSSKKIKNSMNLDDVFCSVKSENTLWFTGEINKAKKMRDEESQNAFRDLFTEYSDGKIYLSDATWQVLRLIPGVDDVAAKELENAVKQGRAIRKVEDFKQVFGISKSSLKGFKEMVKFKPSFFKIVAIAQKGQNYQRAEGVIELTGKGFRIRTLR